VRTGNSNGSKCVKGATVGEGTREKLKGVLDLKREMVREAGSEGGF